MRLPESWVEARLDAVCELNPKLAPADRPADSTEVSFVGMAAVDETAGAITKPEVRTYGDVAKGYTSFKNCDVLFAKVTPCMENGKAAIAGSLLNGLGFGSTEFHVLRATDAVLPEFVFQLIRQPAFRSRAASAFIGTGGLQRVPPDFLARVKLPLPTLPEQRRIVDVLKQAEAVAKDKRSISDLIDQLVRTLYWECFGAWYTSEGLRDPIRIADCIKDSQYGVSEAMGDSGSHAVLRMNSMTSSGWLDLTDLKYASLDKKDAETTQLHDGDLLFNRTNSKELVGKCAIWRGANENFSFASYLIRLRLTSEVLPEYLWATLNSAYGKYRLMNSAKQAVSMANVSPTDLGRITIPLPPLSLQETFARCIKSVEALRTEMLSKLASFDELQSLVTQRALLGELTVDWRDQNRQVVAHAAALRDQLLKASGTTMSVSIDVHARPERQPLQGHHARQAVIAELSDFQAFVFKALGEWKATLLADDSSELNDFAEQWPIEQERNPHDRVRRALNQLAALGLIAKVSLPNERGDYVAGFRHLRSEEESRARDINCLQGILNIGIGLDVAAVRAEVDDAEGGSHS